MKVDIVVACLQVLGLCGNNDKHKDNDFMGRNQAGMSAEEFIQFYACHNADLSELTPNNHVRANIYLQSDMLALVFSWGICIFAPTETFQISFLFVLV